MVYLLYLSQNKNAKFRKSEDYCNLNVRVELGVCGGGCSQYGYNLANVRGKRSPDLFFFTKSTQVSQCRTNTLTNTHTCLLSLITHCAHINNHIHSPTQVKPITYTIYTCRFLARRSALLGSDKDWLGRCQANVTEWRWCWQSGFPMGQHYKVAVSALCHKSVPVLIWP